MTSAPQIVGENNFIFPEWKAGRRRWTTSRARHLRPALAKLTHRLERRLALRSVVDAGASELKRVFTISERMAYKTARAMERFDVVPSVYQCHYLDSRLRARRRRGRIAGTCLSSFIWRWCHWNLSQVGRAEPMDRHNGRARIAADHSTLGGHIRPYGSASAKQEAF